MKFAISILTFLLIPVAFAEDLLGNLRQEHPRLIWTPADITSVKQTIASDPTAAKWHRQIMKTAGGYLAKPDIRYDLSNKKLLVESRAILSRLTTFAGLYRLDGDERFLQAAKKEMLNAASFPDWNPASFLATAEMTNALGLGYDWLYAELTPAEREAIRAAIIEKGLKPGLKIHASGRSWPMVKNNWNAVCNGGLVVGALAIADTDPEIANQVLVAVRKSLPKGLLDFAPDGGWPEGISYWAYTTSYTAFSFSSLQSALGTDFGFTKTPGFPDTGNFAIQGIGNSGQNFNFADSSTRTGAVPQMFWLARTFGKPAYDAWERLNADSKPSIFHLIWFNLQFSYPKSKEALLAMARSVKFDGIQTAFLRSGSGDSEIFVGIKGGDNATNHAHLDLGSFVLDHAGQRFADELGPDSYTLPGYFGKERWSYYRLRTEGQNTLTLDGENQSSKGVAKIIRFSGDAIHPFAIIDLSAGYPAAEKILRGIALDGKGGALLQDEIRTGKPVEITWHLHTEANLALHGKTATLTKGGKTLHATIIEPPDALFSTEVPQLSPDSRSIGRTKKLLIKLPAQKENTRITVRFSPAQAEVIPHGIPLENWPLP